MTFFTQQEFNTKYGLSVQNYQIEMASEMIYSMVGMRFRNPDWTSSSCPTPIKNASMEQLRFMLEYDIPFIDYKGRVEVGDMKSELSSNYSTLSLTILGNAGYLYRGAPLNYNMGLGIQF